MAGIGIALLALAAALCGWRGRRGLRNAFAVLAVLALVLCGTGVAPWLLLDRLQDGYRGVHRVAWRNDNVIVLLGAGNVRTPSAGRPLPGTMAYSRMLAALILYRQCVDGAARVAPASAGTAATAPVAIGVPAASSSASTAAPLAASTGAPAAGGSVEPAAAAPTGASIAVASRRHCTVLVSGGDPQRLGRSEAAVYADFLLAGGVAPRDLRLEPHSRNTRENAHHVAALLARDAAARDARDANRPVPAPHNGVDATVDANLPQLVLVTSAFHMRRALLDFAHFGVGPVAIASDRVGPRASPLAFDWNLAMTDVALIEYLGIARYFVYGALGWNPPPGPPAVHDRAAR